MTDNDIIKALKELLEVMLCEGDLQRASTVSHTIEFINRLQEKNSNLTSDLTSLQNDLTSAKAEVERLTIRLRKAEHQLDDAMKMYSIIQAEAYKECIEKVRKLKGCWGDLEYYSEFIKAETDLDNLLKELVGENDA